MEELFHDMIGDMITRPGGPHLACVLLLDISAFMKGQAIKSLNEGICRFKEAMCTDVIAKNRVDVAIITYGTDVQVVSGFAPVTKMPDLELQAGGEAEMAEGIQTAIDLIKDRRKLYQSIGAPDYKPHIFMITNGKSTSSEENMQKAIQRIRTEEERGLNGQLSFWAVGAGECDMATLFQMTKKVLKIEEVDFVGAFDWLGGWGSMSEDTVVHGKVSFGSLPENARKTEKDRAIGEDWN